MVLLHFSASATDLHAVTVTSLQLEHRPWKVRSLHVHAPWKFNLEEYDVGSQRRPRGIAATLIAVVIVLVAATPVSSGLATYSQYLCNQHCMLQQDDCGFLALKVQHLDTKGLMDSDAGNLDCRADLCVARSRLTRSP